MGKPRGGNWLEDDVIGLRRLGIDIVVSLLEPDEVVESDLTKEQDICKKNSIQCISFPVKDRGVPSSLEETFLLTYFLRKQLSLGKKVAVHCWAGIGRSSLIAACLFVLTGDLPDSSFEHITTKDR